MFVYENVCVCSCVCVRACVRAYVRACVYQWEANVPLLVVGKLEERIVVVRDALSDKRGTVSLDRPADNQGGIRVDTTKACNASRCVRTVYLDDLRELAVRHIRSRRAVIKVGERSMFYCSHHSE